MRTSFRASLLAVLVVPALGAQAPAKRPIRPSDINLLRDVNDPRISPDGRWVAYAVSTVDTAKDRNSTDLWMVSWDGAQRIRLTHTEEASESAPRWSPDGRWLAFRSGRGEGTTGSQVWLLDRRGGEAVKITDYKGGVSELVWSPDGRRLALIVEDPDPADADTTKKAKTKPPIVIDRYKFKQDYEGYLGAQRSHLWVFDVETRKGQQITTGPYDESDPVWSPDGKRIAFVSKRGEDPDRTQDFNVWVVDAVPGAAVQQLTSFEGEDGGSLAWSPDGRWIAFLQSGEPKYYAYQQSRLAVVPATGGATRVLTDKLDRPVADPEWTADGSAIVVTVEDDRTRYVARVRVSDGAVQPLTRGPQVVRSVELGPRGTMAMLVSNDTMPYELHVLEKGALRRLSHHNDSLVAALRLGRVEDFTSRSRDGTEVHSLLTKPADWVASRKYPLLLRIHGGPNGQDEHAFDFERELFAANGYLVLEVNYRGSAGRGSAFQTAIFADWGNLEVVDLLGAVDEAVRLGLADPDKLGIGGWSYGGILTNQVIARDRRFKAATSGAGQGNALAGYGTDMYTLEYETELGKPWADLDAWTRVSRPFLHADRIVTPTLFVCGQDDWNVPLINSEQMYQALKSQGRKTELVIYPGEAHEIRRPSFVLDRMERYLAWYGEHLGASPAGASAGSR
jgi:dipeptidyl aminopeptidase/acylaminoacyl peptidase